MKPLSYANDPAVADWLTWFTSDKGGMTPHPFILSEELGRIGTDGRIGVLTNDGGPIGETKFSEKKKNAPQRLASIFKSSELGPESSPKTTVDGRKFRDIIGPCEYPSLHTCWTCDGKKVVTHSCSCELCEVKEEKCEDCDGLGESVTKPDEKYISIFGNPFNVNFVAYVLAHTPEASQYTIYVAKMDNDNMCFHIVAPNWHAVVACLDKSVKKEHECPEVMDRITAMDDATANTTEGAVKG